MKPQKYHMRAAAIKAMIVLVPSYLAAYLTEQMVWVVPTLAAATFFAGTIQITDTQLRRKLDDDFDDVEEVDDPEGENTETLKEVESAIHEDGAS